MLNIWTPKTAATPSKSARSIRRAAAKQRLPISSRKISGSWILTTSGHWPYISAAEAAHKLGISKRRVQQLCKAGILSSRKIGGIWLVKLD